jgi:hypothetical protein
MGRIGQMNPWNIYVARHLFFWLARAVFRVVVSNRKYPWWNFPQATVASVAQLDRASDFGSEGCRFKSCRMHHISQLFYQNSKFFGRIYSDLLG